MAAVGATTANIMTLPFATAVTTVLRSLPVPTPPGDTGRAMSQETVETSQQAWDRFMAGDTPGVFALLDPEVEVHEAPNMPGASVYHGHAGWQAQVDKFKEAFTDLAYERLECIDCGDENVVSVIQASGRAASSGIAGEATYAQVETWRDGKVASIRYFLSRQDALEAVGLRE